jgi:ABC-type siderophore export system fused ATPase/permease subunit
VCCCLAIRQRKSAMMFTQADCCASGVCDKDKKALAEPERKLLPIIDFFRHAKRLYVAALGIEILCIAAAEIGENTSLYMFGFNAVGIPIAYAMGYALAGFTTFATILGRYNYALTEKIDSSCCSILEQNSSNGFLPNLASTFRNFATGLKKLPQLHKQQNLKAILKTSAYILVTAESACILTAETVDLVFYQYSLLLSVPLALVAGAFTVVAPQAFVKSRRK